MNAWLHALGLDAAKPILGALAAPPLPLLLLTLLGAALLRRRPRLGWGLVWASVALQWALWSPAGADALARGLLQPPPALIHPQSLLASPPPRGQQLILVLGGGRVDAPEYGGTSLNALSLQRLRYGIALSRATGIAVAFSGGKGPGMEDAPSEGQLAALSASADFHHTLSWVEERSRNTHENARFTLQRLRGLDIGRLILVTHDLHEPRALRNFEQARAAAGLAFEIVPAPVGAIDRAAPWAPGDFLPSLAGIARSRYVLHEWLGLLAGA